MSTIYLYTSVSVLIVSLVSFTGIFLLSLRSDLLRRYTFLFMSIAVGALLGDSFIHLIPEALSDATNPTLISILVIVGILLFFVLEKLFHWHHHGEDTEHTIHPVGKLTILSDGVHNFVDGIIIAASFTVSIPIGIATTIAVILHEIPQEIGDFSVLLHAGYTKAKALWLNFLSALAAFLGAFLFFSLGERVETLIMYVIPIAAGGFIYIATADLIPELQKTKSVRSSLVQMGALVIGVACMAALTLLE